MKHLKTNLTIFLFILSFFYAHSQEVQDSSDAKSVLVVEAITDTSVSNLLTGLELNCNTFFKQAEEYFNSGKYQTCIYLLEKGLKECSLSKENKEQALIELIKAYLETDNLESTDKSIKELLKNNPNYTLNKDLVQPDFVRLYNTYRVRPLVIFSIKGGINSTLPNTINSYSILDSVDYNSPYKGRTGSHFGLSAEWDFLKNISLSTDIMFITNNYNRKLEGARGWTLNYKEKISSVEASANIKYYFPAGKITPFVFAGAMINQLISAKSDVELAYQAVDRYTSKQDPYVVSQKNINVKDQRNLNNYGALLGIGARYKYQNLMFGLETSYLIGLTNYSDPDRRYTNNDLLYNYYYVDNDFNLSRISVSVSVGYILKYSIKKKKT